MTNSEIIKASDNVVAIERQTIIYPEIIKLYKHGELVNPTAMEAVDVCMDWLADNIGVSLPTSQKFLQEREEHLAFYKNTLGQELCAILCGYSNKFDHIGGYDINEIDMMIIAKFWRQHQDKVCSETVETYSHEHYSELGVMLDGCH